MRTLSGIALAWGLLAASALAAPGESPISLADPNGQGLALDRLDVRVATHGPLALTELELVFRNTQDRVVEGRFQCTLPTGATVSRFAKEVAGRLMEGEVVERLRATRIYTQILHTMRDPALLKQEQGNRFSARIFPIGAKESVRLLLSYSTVNPVGPDGRRTATVPLAGLGKIGEFRFRAVARPLPNETVELAGWLGRPRRTVVRGRPLYTREKDERNFTPPADIALTFAAGTDTRHAYRMRAGGFEMLAYRPPVAPPKHTGEPAEWVFLVDTSASGATSAEHRLKALGAVLDEVAAGAPGRRISVEAFDLAIEEMGAWTAGAGDASASLARLEERGFLGATNLERALRYLGERARGSRQNRTFVLVTDGIATYGSRDPGDLVRALGAWPAEQRMHILVIGSTQDEDVTLPLTEATRGRVVRVPLTSAFRARAREAADAFRRPLGRMFRVENRGAEWTEPAVFRDVGYGDEILAFSKLTTTTPSAFEVTGEDGKRVAVKSDPIELPDFGPLLERQGYRAYLDLLEAQERATEDPDARAKLREERVRISTTHRVLCPLTALLVLETEEDYERFGIDRKALADIMVVGDEGIEFVERADALPLTDIEKERLNAEKKKASHPPGKDPLIRVRAPEDTRRIVAIFPWGETKLLRKDPRHGYWQTRFIVPKATTQGTYDVILVITRGDGTKERLVFSFHADKKPPRGSGGALARRSDDGWRVSLSVQASPDTVRAEARIPGGKSLPLRRAGGGERFRATFTVGEEVGPSFMVPITLFDRGHNRLVLEVEVELR